MNITEDDNKVGVELFEYAHVRRSAAGDVEMRARYGFSMRVGDNPDFWRARILMPGAEYIGNCAASFGVDNGQCSPSEDWPVFDCVLRAGRSVFTVKIQAPSPEDAAARCAEIGGLRIWIWGGAELTRWEKIKLVARWAWERRPIVRFRSPLRVFDS